jgi:hypothetical protein
MPSTTSATYTDQYSKGIQNEAMNVTKLEEATSTFWRHKMAKHLPLLLETQEFDLTSGVVKFGSPKAKFMMPRTADLAWNPVAHIELPALVGRVKNADGSYSVLKGADAVHWCDAVGFRLLENLSLLVATQELQSFPYVYQYLHDVLTADVGKEAGADVGKFGTLAERQAASKRAQDLWVKLPFWFNGPTVQALPLAAVWYHPLFFEAAIASKEKLVCNPSKVGGVEICVRPNGVTDEQIEGGYPVRPLADDDLKLGFEMVGVFISKAERKLFSDQEFEQCVNEVQIETATLTGVNNGRPTPFKKGLTLKQIVSEYNVVFRRQSAMDANDWFNFDGVVDPASGLTTDVINNLGVRFGTNPRWSLHTPNYWRYVTNGQHRTRKPTKDRIYTIAYGLDSKDLNPNGGCNHDRVENVFLEGEIAPENFEGGDSIELINVATNKNLIRYRQGVANKRFA